MRIDGSLRPDLPPSDGGAKAKASKVDNTVRTLADQVIITGPDKKYVDLAKSAQHVDTDAVAEAKRLLAEGKLSTDQAIDAAAQAMVDLGI